MTYETVSSFAQTWGLLYFFALFLGVLVYALWPSAQKSFDEAAAIPLKEDDQ